jgi:rod shape determining protein RodA
MIEEHSKPILQFDLVLFIPVLLLMIIGVLFIYSSGVNANGISYSNEYRRQIVWIVIALFLILGMSYISYSSLKDLSPWLYLLFISLLILTLFIGKVVNGAKAWIGIFGLGGQPSEFSKIATILFIAKYIQSHQSTIKKISTLFKTMLILLLPMFLILRQPDTGTTLVFVPIFLTMLLISGGQIKHIFFIAFVGFLTLALALYPSIEKMVLHEQNGFGTMIVNPFFDTVLISSFVAIAGLSWFGWIKFQQSTFYWLAYVISIMAISLFASELLRLVLKDYQIMRFIVFLDPNVDPRGSGWNLMQSMTAIGSGGFWGKGFLEGTQSHYRYLPMQSTDFIFSILGEEWGFWGGTLVFTLYSIIIGRMLWIIYRLKDLYGALVIGGFAAILTTHLFINVGMTMGIMPVTGIPLYFLSYGGSSLMAASIAIGITMNIYNRRFMY